MINKIVIGKAYFKDLNKIKNSQLTKDFYEINKNIFNGQKCYKINEILNKICKSNYTIGIRWLFRILSGTTPVCFKQTIKTSKLVKINYNQSYLRRKNRINKNIFIKKGQNKLNRKEWLNTTSKSYEYQLISESISKHDKCIFCDKYWLNDYKNHLFRRCKSIKQYRIKYQRSTNWR